MSAPNGNNGIWGRIGLALMVPVAAGLIGYGVLKSDVAHVRATVESKASREVVDAQYQSILRELQSLRQLIERRP